MRASSGKPRSRTWRLFPRTFISALSYLLTALGVAAAQQLDRSEVPAPVASRTVAPRFEHLRLEDGLSQGSVHDIFQDSRGFIWLTTQDGLNRYDGHEVKSFTHQPFDDTSLGPGFSFGMDEDASGTLWIGNASGLNQLDPLSETFSTFRHDPGDTTSIGPGPVSGVTIDSDGRLWAATSGGLSRMDPSRPGVFETFRYDPNDPTSLCDNVVYGIYEDHAGLIWIGTRNGICTTDRQSPGTFERVLMGPEPRPPGGFGEWGHEAYFFLERPEEPGVLWVGMSRGMVRINAETREIERFVFDPDYDGGNILQNVVWRLAQDPTNPSILWVPTVGAGLYRFDVRTKQFVRYGADERDPNGLLEDAIISVFADRSGVVWVGNQTLGASRFNPASVSFAHYRAGPSDDPASLPGANVWGIHQSRDGIVWVGTQDKARQDRLTALDRANGVATHYEHDPNVPFSRDPGSVMLIHEDRQGNLWVGSSRGLDLLDRKTGRFTHFRPDPDDPLSIQEGARSMLDDRSGNLWVGTFNGIAKMRSNALGRFERFVNDPDDPNTILRGTVGFLIEDLAGFIWAATTAGLCRLNPETGTASCYEHDPDDATTLAGRSVRVVLERRREPGVLWLGTGAGMDRLDVKRGEFRHFTVREGLANNTVYGILEDDQGHLWITTNHGLSRFDPDTEAFKNYGLEIGLQSLEFSQSAFHKGVFGEFFIGGTNGLNAFFPNEISENQHAPEVQLVDLKLFNRSVKETGAVNLTGPLSETEEIRLDYAQKEITFDFVAFHYADPTGNEYAYKLEGFNDDWVYVGDQRTASFTNLSPGEYTFRVKAANSDGVWNEEGADIRIVVEPPFWMTWWFRFLAVLGLASVLYVGYRLRTAHLEARARELEGEVDKRTHELKESNTQLEQSHTIVEAINRETSFRRLLTKILEESRVIPGVEKATAMVKMPDGLFHVRASSGWDVDAMQNIRLTPDEAKARYVTNAEELAEDIFVAKDAASRAATERMAEFGQVASFLVLRIIVDDDVAGYLVFDNLTDTDAFEQRDVELLKRLREHITSAFIKTRILEDLQNTLDNLRSTQDRLVQSEKMASLGQLTAGIAHEIKNPLNFVNNFSDVTAELANEMAAELASRREQMPLELVEVFEGMIENLKLNAQKINEHGRRADGIVKSMLEHSRSGDREKVPTDINDLLEEYLVLSHHALRSQDGDFDVHIERDLDYDIGKVVVVPQEMGRVFVNLIGNAFDALRESRSGYRESGAEPTLSVVTAKADGRVEIRISDNGPGIPDDVKSRIFEPFFTTKPTGSGTGLGLSMSYDIVTKGHGGELEVVSEPGEGATFIVRLPA